MKKISTIEAPKHPNVKIAVRNFGPIAEGTVDLRPCSGGGTRTTRESRGARPRYNAQRRLP